LENAIVSKFPVEILVGKKNLEIRPMSVNKGEIVKRILAKNSDTNLVICAGDDKTDEDMFRALSAAHYQQKQLASPVTSLKVSSPVSPSSNTAATTTTTTTTTSQPAVIWQEQNSNLYSITVGPSEKKTHANWHVNTPQQIIQVLETLAALK
jgi:trehalose 6-phosphate synthase/phosphatase